MINIEGVDQRNLELSCLWIDTFMITTLVFLSSGKTLNGKIGKNLEVIFPTFPVIHIQEINYEIVKL